MTTKLFVGNLPEACRKGDFKKIFEGYGKVVECDIVRNYGFVHFEKEDEAKAAVEGLNNSNFEGSELKVELSHSKVRQKPGMGCHGECYRCGRNGHWSKDCPRGPSRTRRKNERFSNSGTGDGYGNYCRQSPFINPYNDRYPPPPPMPNPSERFRPYPESYERRPPMQQISLPPMNRPSYDFNRDPYERPPPEYYRRNSPSGSYQDPYFDSCYNRRSGWE